MVEDEEEGLSHGDLRSFLMAKGTERRHSVSNHHSIRQLGYFDHPRMRDSAQSTTA